MTMTKRDSLLLRKIKSVLRGPIRTSILDRLWDVANSYDDVSYDINTDGVFRIVVCIGPFAVKFPYPKYSRISFCAPYQDRLTHAQDEIGELFVSPRLRKHFPRVYFSDIEKGILIVEKVKVGASKTAQRKLAKKLKLHACRSDMHEINTGKRKDGTVVLLDLGILQYR